MVFTHFSPEWNKKTPFAVLSRIYPQNLLFAFDSLVSRFVLFFFVIDMNSLKGFCQFVSILCNLFV